jgi:hypothetical protein
MNGVMRRKIIQRPNDGSLSSHAVKTAVKSQSFAQAFPPDVLYNRQPPFV